MPNYRALGLANKQENKLRGFCVCLHYLDIMWANNHSWQFFCFVASATLCPIFPVISCTEVFTRQSFIPVLSLKSASQSVSCIVFNRNMSRRWPFLAMVVCPLWSFPQPLMKRKCVSHSCNNPLAAVRIAEREKCKEERWIPVFV